MKIKVIKTQNNSKNCIICGMDNPLSVKAPFYILEDETVASVFKFKTEHQSYPDRTHGGMVGALLDELMGRALWIYEPETFGVTTTLTITYRKAVPLNTLIKARAYITFMSTRGFVAKGELFDMENNLLATGESKYFKMPFQKVFDENSTQHEEMCYEMPIDYEYLDFPPINK